MVAEAAIRDVALSCGQSKQSDLWGRKCGAISNSHSFAVHMPMPYPGHGQCQQIFPLQAASNALAHRNRYLFPMGTSLPRERMLPYTDAQSYPDA